MLHDSNLHARISKLRRTLDQQAGELRALEADKHRLEEESTQLTKNIDLYTKASIILNSVADKRQNKIQRQIEALVTEGLQSIFGDKYSFHLVPSIKASKQVIDIVVRTVLANGKVFDANALTSHGGGVSSVVGMLLRLVILLLTKPKQDKILVLDETFSHLSEEYRPAVADFIRQIVDKTNTQAIMISHFHDLTEPADKVYDYSISKTGESIIKELR